MTKPLPLTNPARLQTLQDLDLLDSPFEAAFDRLTNLAAQFCHIKSRGLRLFIHDIGNP